MTTTTQTTATAPLIDVAGCSKRFPLPEGKGEFTVLRDINLSVRKGEVLALLGRSGSGKSTLLRIMAGLIPPSEGTVSSDGGPLHGSNPNVSMVFQSFALLPWLTVLENVELGLEARDVPRATRSRKAFKAIDLVGLDGFESAYPRELSGGMKQRVGFARAFVVEPKVLFMDEPFSALDVLTAENLRGEIDDLWNAKQFPSQSIVIVTHNIEEAVLLADRVVILGANPGRIRGEIAIDMPRPHNRNDERFKDFVDFVYTVMTNPEAAVERATPAAGAPAKRVEAPASPFAQPLPHVRVGGLSGLLELLAERAGTESDISEVAESLQLPIDDLLAIIDAGSLLDFTTVKDGEISLTEIGRDFATTTILRSKDLFRQQATQKAPMIAAILKLLREEEGQMKADVLRDELGTIYPDPEAERQFATAIDWGRYSELFEFEADDDIIILPERELDTIPSDQ